MHAPNMFVRIASLLFLPLAFLFVQLGLFQGVGRLADWLLLDANPDWYEGPLGGIHQLPIFIFLVPVSAWIALQLWRNVKRHLRRESET